MEKKIKDSKITTICLLILTAIAIAVSLYMLRPVMIPFVISAFFAFSLLPCVDLLVRKLKIPRTLAVVGVLIVSFGILFIFASLFIRSTSLFAKNADTYQQIVKTNIIKMIDGINPDAAKKTDIEQKWDSNSESPDLTNGVENNTFIIIKEEFNSLVENGSVQKQVVRLSKMLADILSQSLLIFIFVMFIMLGSKPRKKPVSGVWGEVEHKIRFFLIKKVILSAATGFLVGLVLKILGIKFAIFFGFLSFMLNFIPSIGSIIATLLPLPMAFLHSKFGVGLVLMTLLIPGVIQFIIGSVLEPKIMGEALDLHPVVILMALIFWGMIWGIVGMLLATPITAIIKILLEKSEPTSSIADLMAGRLDSLMEEN